MVRKIEMMINDCESRPGDSLPWRSHVVPYHFVEGPHDRAKKSSFYTCVDSDANYDASIKGRQHSARNFLLILESTLKPHIPYIHTVYTILPN